MLACLVLFACACGQEESGDAADTGSSSRRDTGANDVGSGSADADEDAGRRDSGGVEDVSGTTDTGESDVRRDDGVGLGEACANDEQCPVGAACRTGVCAARCSLSSDCDDGNVCTVDECAAGYCARTPLEISVADAVAGDCRRLACVDGALIEVGDDGDLPADDGNPCTREACSNRFPRHYPDNALCDDGDVLNGEEVCSVAQGGCAIGDRPYWICDPFEPGWGDEEVCGDGQDNDNDGDVDEDCECEFGAVQSCFTGPPNARAVGGCLDGVQRCIDRANPRWSDCTGDVTPQEEICDAKDNDCNTCIDDIEECDAILECPVDDTARPLTWYGLNARAIFEGEASAYEWTITAPANSATTGAEDPNAGSTRVYFDVSGDYSISLTLQDDKGDTYGCSWVVHVRGSGLRVEMVWDTFGSVDMDLHLHRSGTTSNFCTGDDCYYANCQGSWGSVAWGYSDSPPTECPGGTSSCHNPRLDIDNIRGYDPENINIDNPNNGDTFRVMAHMFSGSPTTNPVITIYCGGSPRAVLGTAPDAVGLTRSGGGCQGQTWRVADVQMLVMPDGTTDCFVHVLTDGEGDWDIRENDASY